jgi:transglutaminase-like putative cysteine protease
MTARYRIRHLSRYVYEDSVTASFNEARLTPLKTAWQTPLESEVRVEAATWLSRYRDYWGTQVRVFEVAVPHRELSVAATSLVEVDASRRPVPDETLTWEQIRDPKVTDDISEYLPQTPSTEPPHDLAAQAAELAAAAATPHDAAQAIADLIHESMTYEPGSTGVTTVAAEAWVARRGVCQDYAHLAIGALRHVGIPARYVSGYVHPSEQKVAPGEPPPTAAGASVPLGGTPITGESHAWVEWWIGDWSAHDPTLSEPVGDQHVVVGCGRDYADVPPIKGIVAGDPGKTDLTVEVTITRVA